MKVQLSNNQKRFIREIIRIQLNNLRNILNENTEEIDVTMECIEMGVNKADMMNLVRRNIQTYKKVFYLPERFLELPEDQLCVMKHILHNTEFSRDMELPRRQIWIKMLIHEKFNYNPN